MIQTPPTPTCQKKCGSCPRKLILSDISCGKCSIRYCVKHRLPELHSCQHDFKEEGRRILTEANPQVVADKLGQRI